MRATGRRGDGGAALEWQTSFRSSPGSNWLTEPGSIHRAVLELGSPYSPFLSQF
jgi:hypothetical protein